MKLLFRVLDIWLLQYSFINGAKPVFADVDLDTFCIDLNSIKKKITKKTKLIVLINTYGNVCDLKPIENLPKIKKLMLWSDLAESAGSLYNKTILEQ